MPQVKIDPSWLAVLQQEFDQPYFDHLINFIKQEYSTKTIYPEGKNIFRAFELCPFDQVKVVILGQDPYHGPGQANGLCFSVNDGVQLPPSLQNIYKEMATDLHITAPNKGNLENWSRQGVLLLNATLTVRANQAGSHQKKGWENFTDAVIKTISDQKDQIVFILWGKYAQDKGKVIDRSKHFVIISAHPSPLSAYNGFWGSKPFSKTNTFLTENGKSVINWEKL